MGQPSLPKTEVAISLPRRAGVIGMPEPLSRNFVVRHADFT